ncbi:Transketolase, pyrimidine binding domain [Micromonospora citrea]|uniref:Transketolase, pyrimidine binding domain n=1 Tax=Micromonospora citrea TaxID=47855 RepID=A0A1C6TVH1_9ACTN|nr:Transketolase, pyrimidine binding domain [Micromonospora citrea]
MPRLSYRKALTRALADELARDESVFPLGEDIRVAASNVTAGLFRRLGPDRVCDRPLSEQAFTSFATGAALAGLRPVVEFQIPSLLFLVFEQIVNRAHKFPLMTGGQCAVPVTYLVPGSGSRTGWAGQHSDHPYSLFADVGVTTVVPATPADAYGLLVSAVRCDDPVVVFAPAGVLDVHDDGGAECNIDSSLGGAFDADTTVRPYGLSRLRRVLNLARGVLLSGLLVVD